MAKWPGRVLGSAAVALGLGHLSVAAFVFERLSMDALWFIGSGVAIVLGGVLNLFAQAASYGAGGRILLIAANLLILVFFGLVMWVVPEPQVIVGTVLFAALLVQSLIRDPRTA